MLQEFKINSSAQVEMVNITDKIKRIVNKTEINTGIVVIYTPHTTAGITINESADPAVVKDIVTEINKVIPFNDNYQHFEGNSAAHIKSSLFAASETIIIENQRLLLGRWQGIYFCEFDGPRTRKIMVKIIKG